MARYDYDLVTIGAGSGGVRATRMAGGFGARTAIIEKSRVGGTCVMRGCVPKKLLIYGAHFGEDIVDARAYGWSVEDPTLDWGALIAAKNAELDRLETVYLRILHANNVELVEGAARLADAHTVEVDGRTLTAEKVLVATGGWPTMPQIPGIENVITSNEALDLPDLPRRVAIVGGGYIAVEFAGIFNAAGAEVTEIIRAGEVLRGFDEDIRGFVSAEMQKKGVCIHRDCTVSAIETCTNGYKLMLGHDDELEVDAVMYATGRAPNTAGLGLAEAGVALTEKGAVVVDEWYRSSVENVFAIGDVTDRVALTPVAIAEGMCFAHTQFRDTPQLMDYDSIPTAVFSQPPVGTVGLSESEACRRGPVDVYVSRFKPMKHTLTGRDESTMMKLVVDQKSDRVLGCHMVGLDAPEIIQGLAVALKCGATKAQFDSTVGIHPTAAEEFVTMREKRPEHEGPH